VPSDLGSRLVLWFDAARGVSAADGARMDEWLDQSSAHNDALQSVVARQPIYTTSGVNDLPAVAFDGETTFLEIPDDATLRFGTGPFALFAVVRGAPATGINAMVYQKSDADDPWAGPALLVNPNKPAASTKASFQLDGSTYVNSSGSVGDSVPRLLGGRRFQGSTGTRVELRIDGVPESNVVPNAAVNVDAPGRNAIIGHNGYLPSPGFQAYAGTISEICAVKGSLSDDELAGLEGYLLDKYGLR
jgi:hypothetical protein